VVWHHSLPLMNSFNKTEAAVFSCRLCFLWAFPFISFFDTVYFVRKVFSFNIFSNYRICKNKPLNKIKACSTCIAIASDWLCHEPLPIIEYVNKTYKLFKSFSTCYAHVDIYFTNVSFYVRKLKPLKTDILIKQFYGINAQFYYIHVTFDIT